MTNEVLTVMWRDVQLFVVIACYFAVGFAVWAILIIGPRKTATSICNLVMGWWRRAAELLAERRSRLEREQINQFRAKHPARIVGVPDLSAAKRTVDDLNRFIAAADAYRPTTSNASISFPFSFPRNCEEPGDGPDPEPWSINLDSLSIVRGYEQRDIYESVISQMTFPHSLWDQSKPEYPRITLPKWDMKIVTADTGGEIDFRVEGLRKMYAKEIAQVDKLTEMAQQIEALQKKADEANDFMEIHIANERLALHQKERIYEEQFEQQLGPIKRVYDEYKSRTNAGIERHFQFSLRTLPLPLPSDFPWSTFYDPSQRLLQINQRVPFIPDILVKRPESKRPPAKRDVDYFLRRLVPAISLHIAQHVALNDIFDNVDAIAVNCWCRYYERTSGRLRNAFVSSLNVEKKNILEINIDKADALDAFRALRGAYVYSTDETVPIEPQIRLDKKDDRFVQGKEVLEGMAQGQNLATMDWQDFEHLIRELFAKEFGSKEGSEVKITRASRDRGVDAVVFDPDPLRGGKYVVQAKRYNNLVDVSAVRDLWGTVLNEGAARGILVTTSKYGRDAHDFVSNKPLTLIDGQNLLALLAKHGFKFKIELT